MSEHTSGRVSFTWERVDGYARIECVGQYLLAAYFINMALAPHRPEIEVLLDFGCGAGKSTRAVCPSVRPSAKVIGADVSADFLSAAATETYHAIATDANRLLHVGSFDLIGLVVRGDEEQTPLSENSVNAVTTTIVLQEIQSERLSFSAIKEMGRVAKSGGRLAIAAVSDRLVNPRCQGSFGMKTDTGLTSSL